MADFIGMDHFDDDRFYFFHQYGSFVIHQFKARAVQTHFYLLPLSGGDVFHYLHFAEVNKDEVQPQFSQFFFYRHFTAGAHHVFDVNLQLNWLVVNLTGKGGRIPYGKHYTILEIVV